MNVTDAVDGRLGLFKYELRSQKEPKTEMKKCTYMYVFVTLSIR
jgi:hypothetical protein